MANLKKRPRPEVKLTADPTQLEPGSAPPSVDQFGWLKYKGPPGVIRVADCTPEPGQVVQVWKSQVDGLVATELFDEVPQPIDGEACCLGCNTGGKCAALAEGEKE